jgi:hypothetical protein
MSNIGGKLTRRKFPQRSLEYMGSIPLGIFCVDAVNEQYYPVGNYEDQYMRWTTLRQERGQAVLDFTNTFHTLHTKLGIVGSQFNFFNCPKKLPTPMSLELQIFFAFCKHAIFSFQVTFAN